MSEAVASRVAVLPDVVVTVAGEPVRLPPRVARLIAFLAVERGRHTRGAVATALWPETTADRAHASLRATVFAMPPRVRSLLALTGPELELEPEIDVDVHVATRRAVALLADDGLVPDSETLQMLGCDVLAGWSEEWLTCHQVRYAQLRAQALEASVRRFSARGRHGLAVDAALAARQCDPLRESAHLALVRAHAAQGNRYQAVDAYRGYVRMLREELGIAPQVQLAEIIGAGSAAQPPERHLVAVAARAVVG
jgi:DNA-binding SARP family transcriptional activator